MALSMKKIKELELEFMMDGSITNCCKKLGINFATGKKYMTRLDWAKKREHMLETINKSSIKSFAQLKIESQQVVNQFRKKFFTELNKAMSKMKIGKKDILALIKLMQEFFKMEYYVHYPGDAENANTGVTLIVKHSIPSAPNKYKGEDVTEYCERILKEEKEEEQKLLLENNPIIKRRKIPENKKINQEISNE